MRWRIRGMVAVLGLALGCSSEGDANKDAGVGGGSGAAGAEAGRGGGGGTSGTGIGGTGAGGASAGRGAGDAGSAGGGMSGAGGIAASGGAAGSGIAGTGGGMAGATAGIGGSAAGASGAPAGAGGGLAGAAGGPAGATGASGAPGGAGGGAGGTAGAAGASGAPGGAGGAAGAGGGLAGAAGGTAGAAGASGAPGGAGGGAGGSAGAAGASGAPGGAGGSTTGAGGVGGNAGSAGGASGSGLSCGSFARPATLLPPDILVVLDASGSMNQDTTNQSCTGGCGANSKWALMTAALTQVVSQTDTTVNWGLKLFADSGTCGVAPATVAIPVGAGNAAAIASAIAARTDANGNVLNGSSTPTRRAEEAAAAYLSTLTDANSKYILLATDGLPNCMPGGSSSNDDTPGAIAAVTSARLAGFPTFVVGISAGGDVADSALSAMALEGGRPRAASPPYYPVTSGAELVATLNTLVSVTARCEYAVPNPPTSDGTTSRADLWVMGDGTRIERDANHVNGWDYTSAAMTSVALYGAPCDAVKAGTVQTITIVFRCRIL